MWRIIYSGVNTFKSRVHYASKRVLTQYHRNELKQWLISRRKKWARLYVLIYGRYTANDLVNELRSRLPNDFEILMVHSAYDRLLPMYSGTSQEIINRLMEFCGDNRRTLAMPAFVLGGRSYDVCSYYSTHEFNARKTPSEMGLLTEAFRRMPGVSRSLHPTHSVCAVGPLAELLTAKHHFASTRTGLGTPFEVMAQRKTVIVGLGIEYYRCLTQTHTAEDMLGDAFPVRFAKNEVPATIITPTGTRLEYELKVLKTDRSMNNGIVRSLLSREELREWRFRGTPLFMTFADKVTNRLIEAAKKGITIYGGNRN